MKHMKLRLATDVELSLCHSAGYIRALSSAVHRAVREGEAVPVDSNNPDCETFIFPGSMEAVRGSVGGLLSLVDEALRPAGKRLGIALCRPPGHHAMRASGEGFCLVNNVGVATAYAQARYPLLVKRVLIIDWDVHHGNGTQNIFSDDPNTLFFSVHRFEKNYYPESGDADEVGEDDGSGCTVNVPLQKGFGDAELWAAFSDVLLPTARRFQPDLIIVSAGFDAVSGDPVGKCECSPRGFGAITTELRRLAAELCRGRLLFALEGGYNCQRTAECLEEVALQLVKPMRRSGDKPFQNPPQWLCPKFGTRLQVPFRLLADHATAVAAVRDGEKKIRALRAKLAVARLILSGKLVPKGLAQTSWRARVRLLPGACGPIHNRNVRQLAKGTSRGRNHATNKAKVTRGGRNRATNNKAYPVRPTRSGGPTGLPQSGVRGVTWSTYSNAWIARLTSRGEGIFGGTFSPKDPKDPASIEMACMMAVKRRRAMEKEEKFRTSCKRRHSM